MWFVASSVKESSSMWTGQHLDPDGIKTLEWIKKLNRTVSETTISFGPRRLHTRQQE
jgi:hypothetical protein